MKTGGAGSGIKRSSFFGILARSFLVQSSWNYKGMQNLGLATMTIPALRKDPLIKNDDELRTESLNQLEFFNTHPYLASAVAGLILSLKSRAEDENTRISADREARDIFMGPMGAMGDDFFWASLRPFAGCLGVLLAMAGKPLAGILLFLCLYNLFHFKTRWSGLSKGLEGTEALITMLRNYNFHQRALFIRRLSAFLLFTLPLFWIVWEQNPLDEPIWLMLLVIFIVMPAFVLIAGRVDPRKNVLLVLSAAILTVSLWGMIS